MYPLYQGHDRDRPVRPTFGGRTFSKSRPVEVRSWGSGLASSDRPTMNDIARDNQIGDGEIVGNIDGRRSRAGIGVGVALL